MASWQEVEQYRSLWGVVLDRIGECLAAGRWLDVGIGSGVDVGGALRLVQQDVAGTSDVGFGFDLSASFQRCLDRRGDHRLALGANLRHVLEPSVRLAGDEVVEPRSLKLGAGYTGQRPDGRFSWCLAADADLPRGVDARVGLGTEVSYARTLALRAGLDDGHPTFGVGVAWAFVTVDYAMRADGDLSRNDRFTLGLRMGRSVTERRAERQAAREQAVMDRLAQLVQERETRERTRILASADSAFALQDYDDALKFYRRVLAIEPDDAVEKRAQDSELRLALRATDGRMPSCNWQPCHFSLGRCLNLPRRSWIEVVNGPSFCCAQSWHGRSCNWSRCRHRYGAPCQAAAKSPRLMRRLGSHYLGCQ